MPSILDQILAHKRGEVEQARRERPLEALQRMPSVAVRPRNFFGAVTAPRRKPNLIAEVKRSSPSAGVIREDFDPVAVATAYAEAGAVALSVLTDEKFFGGHLSFIERVKDAVGQPVLRKDFLIDPYQIHESRAFGADAILLIAEAFELGSREGLNELAGMVALAIELDLTVLLEVHDRDALMAVLSIKDLRHTESVLLGINNRDLRTQTVDIGNTERLAALVPPVLPLVAESGVKTAADVRRLARAGARALLVGETLMRSEDVGATIDTLFNDC